MRLRSLIPLFLISTLSGCSVFMASNGRPATDTSVLAVGTPRWKVEASLGTPVAPLRAETPEDVVSYQYFAPEAPKYGRAAVYGVLDVATLGLAELVNTPIEALQGDKYIVEVRYDLNKKVQGSDVYLLKAPIEEPEKIIGVDCESCQMQAKYDPKAPVGSASNPRVRVVRVRRDEMNDLVPF